MTSEVESISALIAEAIAGDRKPFTIEAPEGRTFLVVPGDGNHWSHFDITSPNKAEVLLPKHVKQSVSLQTVESMVEYVQRFKNFDSALFADITKNTIVTVIDYHKMPEANRPADANVEAKAATGADSFSPQTQLGQHRAGLIIPFSYEWQTWTKIDGSLMKHVDFANFLEENSMDILPFTEKPTGSKGEILENAPTTILELCRELQVKSGMQFNSAVRSGDYTNIEFQKGEDVATKGGFAMPLSIDLLIPVYFGEQSVPVKAFMRRKVDNGTLMLGIKLNRAENIRQEEFHRIVGHVANSVELSTVYGTPF